MSTEDRTSIFESLRCSIQLIGETPSALDEVEKGICQLELKFAKYAKSMTEVLQVHSQMKREIEKLKETVAQKESEILLTKQELEKSQKIALKLKREKHRLKKRKKGSSCVEKPISASTENDTSSNNLIREKTNYDHGNEEGTTEIA